MALQFFVEEIWEGNSFASKLEMQLMLRTFLHDWLQQKLVEEPGRAENTLRSSDLETVSSFRQSRVMFCRNAVSVVKREWTVQDGGELRCW